MSHLLYIPISIEDCPKVQNFFSPSQMFALLSDS